MRIELAGLAFDVGPDRVLTNEEQAALGALDRTGAARDPRAPEIRLEIVPGEPVEGPPAGSPDHGPAAVTETNGGISLRHARFAADLEPLQRHGRLRRDPSTSAPLEITLRTALCCALPLEGCVALHAAGLVIDGRGAVFFGPSGAGKTTLSRLSPHPVLSDELVVVSGPPWELRPSGTWGEFGPQSTSLDAVPLEVLADLGKGSKTVFTPLATGAALRRLLGVVVLPPSVSLWDRALGIVAELVRSVPTFRLEWSPAAPPWRALETVLSSENEEGVKM
jgi:hypothetical protein